MDEILFLEQIRLRWTGVAFDVQVFPTEMRILMREIVCFFCSLERNGHTLRRILRNDAFYFGVDVVPSPE